MNKCYRKDCTKKTKDKVQLYCTKDCAKKDLDAKYPDRVHTHNKHWSFKWKKNYDTRHYSGIHVLK